MKQDQLEKDLERATEQRGQALRLLHTTLDEYIAEVATQGRQPSNGMRRGMLLQNFADACTMLGGLMAEERRLIHDMLNRKFTPEGTPGTQQEGK